MKGLVLFKELLGETWRTADTQSNCQQDKKSNLYYKSAVVHLVLAEGSNVSHLKRI